MKGGGLISGTGLDDDYLNEGSLKYLSERSERLWVSRIQLDNGPMGD